MRINVRYKMIQNQMKKNANLQQNSCIFKSVAWKWRMTFLKKNCSEKPFWTQGDGGFQIPEAEYLQAMRSTWRSSQWPVLHAELRVGGEYSIASSFRWAVHEYPFLWHSTLDLLVAVKGACRESKKGKTTDGNNGLANHFSQTKYE